MEPTYTQFRLPDFNIYLSYLTGKPKSDLFLSIIKNSFETLASKPLGNQLISYFKNPYHSVTIRYSSTISKCKAIGSYRRRSSIIFFSLKKQEEIPYFAKLAHLLIHAERFQKGINYNKCETKCYESSLWDLEEFETVNVNGPVNSPHFANYSVNENNILKEHDLPPRLMSTDAADIGVAALRQFLPERSQKELDATISKFIKNIFSQISHQLDFDYENSSFNSSSARYFSTHVFRKLEKGEQLSKASTQESLLESIQENYLSELVD